MKLVLATGNKGKIKEFQEMFEEDVIPFASLLGDLDIVEDGDSFASNALI